jgi:alpha,alpha-trehalose phosphorylase
MQQRPDAFTAEQKARNFAYYERLTVRDSSLSAATQSVIAAEVDQLELAYDYLAESALIDLNDTELNVADGLHLAALVGAWTTAVVGLSGLRSRYGKLTFAPRLPAPINEFTLRTGTPLTLAIPPIARPEQLSQPPGREPARRSQHRADSGDSGLTVLVAQHGRPAEPVTRLVG